MRGDDRLKLLPLFVLIALIGVSPFFGALYNSFFHDYFGDRSFAALENYFFIFSDRAFIYSLRITMLWALCNTFFSILLALVLAAFLYESKRFFRWIYFALLVPWAIPIYISVPLWRMIVHGNGGNSLLSRLIGVRINLLEDPVLAFISVLTVSIWMNLPLISFVFYAGLRKIPASVIDSARLEGAGSFVRFHRIYLPMIGGSIAIMSVFSFIASFKEFTLPFMMTAGGPPLVSGITERHIIGASTTVEILLYDIFMKARDFGIPAAYAVLTAALVVLIMVLWFFVKAREVGQKRISAYFAGVEVLLGGRLGLIPAVLFTVSLLFGGTASGRRRQQGFLIGGFAVDGLIWLYSLTRFGFLEGFHIPTLFILIGLFVLKRRSSESRLPRRYRAGGGERAVRISGRRQKRKAVAASRLACLPSGLPDSLWRVFSIALALFMLLSALLIIYMVIWMSLSDLQAAYIDRPLPMYLSFHHFIDIFTEEGILRYFCNTFVVAALTGLLTPLVTFPAAHAVAGMGANRSVRLFTFIQMLGLLGGIHALIPLFALFRSFGLVNNYLPVILIYMMHAVPFSLFSIASYLEQIPKELEEVSRLEGAGPVRHLVTVLLPLSLPIVVTSMMLAFISAWNGFLVPLIFLQDDSLFTIGVKIHEFVGSIASGTPRWGLFAATSVINMAIITLLFSRFKRPLENPRLSEQQ